MNTDQSDPTPAKRRAVALWRKIIAWVLGTALALSITLLLAVTAALWWLSPERLTPLVNGFLSNYLDAEVSSSRVELTLWSTFPHIELEVDSLKVISHRFDRLSPELRAMLPADADSLLSVDGFSGGIHLLKIATGEIDLYDIRISNPRVNAVIAPDSTANYDIVPPSEPSTEPSVMPRVSIDRFAILGEFPIHYRAMPDTIDVALVMNTSSLTGADAPQYTIELAGGADTRLGSFTLPKIPFSINGDVEWDQAEPDLIRLSGFDFTAMGTRVTFNALLSLSDPLTLKEFDLSLPEFAPGVFLPIIAPDDAALKPLSTDLTMSVTAKLLAPYSPSQSELPHVQVDMGLKASKLIYEQLNLDALDASLTAVIDDADLDRSTVDIHRFHASGRAIDVTLKASLSRLLSDPKVDGTFRGSVSLDRLPKALTSKLPMRISGMITGEASYAFRMSMLTPKHLHKVRLNGHIDLNDFRVTSANPADSTDAYIGFARFALGTDSHVTSGDRIIDSLFTASLNIDTLALSAPGVNLTSGNLAAKLGSRNVASSSDTSQINPFGASITAESILLQADSAQTRIRLRDIKATGTLMRYDNNARAPHVEMTLHAGRASMRDNTMRTSVSGVDATLSFHPRARKAMSPAMQARYDSLAALYPDLPSDSLRKMARRSIRGNRTPVTATDNGRENIDFNIDNSLSSWLRLWQLSGTLKARRARLYTAQFPIRSRLSDLDFTFSTDSVLIRNTRLECGHSDFVINGSVRDIRRALTSRSRRAMEIDLDVVSDTIDFNEISATLLRGSAYSQPLTGRQEGVPTDEDIESDDFYADIPADGDTTMTAIVVPSNIHADLRMRASTILYTDLTLHNFEGHVGVFDGAVDLDRFRADADMGSLELTALYSAPTMQNIQFAAGLKLHRLLLAEALKIMPQIDSLMPMLSGISGIVDASVAVTTTLDSAMNINLPATDVAIRLTGDSLVLLDTETFKTVAKWMLFKNKKRNMIDHMDVEIMVHDGAVNLYPVIFDMDRYRIGVVGNNDLALNLDYHVAVLRSPLPFRFGINIKGTPENMKIRLGKARVDEKKVAQHQPFAENIRVNLLTEMHNLFTRGVRATGMHGLRSTMQHNPSPTPADNSGEVPSTEATLEFIRQGLVNLDTTPRTIDPEKQKKLKKAGRAGKRAAQ